MTRYFVFLFLIFTALNVQAASDTGRIIGTVIDAASKEPLPGVNIQVIGSTNGAATDLQGRYAIEGLSSATYRLKFSFIGYIELKKTDIIVTSIRPAEVNVELRQTYLKSEAITVTAGYFVEENSAQPSVLGLSREEIRRFPGGFEDVLRTVTTLPGVAVSSFGGRNDLLVRGGGPSENLFIINNIEVPNLNHFGTQGTGSGTLSFVNLDFVDNVSFSTGGFTAQYGDKMSSVLSLEMSEGRKDKFGAKLFVSATQYGLNIEGPLGAKGNFIFSARESYLDLIFKAAGLPFVPVYTDFNFVMNFNLSDRDKLFVLGLGAIDRIDRDLGSERNKVINAQVLDNRQNQYIGGINYRRLQDNGYVDVTLNHNQYRFRFSQIDDRQQEYFNSRANEFETALKLQRFLEFGKGLGLTTGVSGKWIALDSQTAFADTIYDRSGNRIPLSLTGLVANSNRKSIAGKYAAFSELDWIASSSLNINAGIRADFFDFLDQPFYISPRLTARYKISEQFSVKASSGLYYQSPSYVWTVNPQNKQLKALRNYMNVIGLDFLLRDDLRLSLEGFYKSYSDLPSGITPGRTDYLVITNTGTGFGGNQEDFQSFGFFPMTSTATGRAYGLELLLQKKFSQVPCYGQFSLSYGKSDYNANDGNSYPGPFDQRIILNLSGGYKLNEQWEFSGKYRFFTGAPITPVYRPSANNGQIQNLPEEYLSKRLTSTSILDVRVDRYFQFADWRLITFLDIQNVLNQKVKFQPRYDFWEDEIQSSGSIGILPSIGISVGF